MYIYIRGMSEHRSKIYDNLVAASEQVDLHIIKLMMYPKSDSYDHWIHEIWSFLHKVDRLRGTHKYPKYKFIYHALSVHNDIVDNLMKLVVSEEGKSPQVQCSESSVLRVLTDYQSWASNELSSSGILLPDSVRSKLEELL